MECAYARRRATRTAHRLERVFVCLCARRYLLSKSSINFAMDVDYMIQDLFDYVR